MDSVVYPEPGPSDRFTDLAASGDGNLYAVGYQNGPGGNITGTWLRRSSDGGNSWLNISRTSVLMLNLSTGAEGRVYLAGTVDRIWEVWQSEDQGASWTTLDSHPLPDGRPSDIAVDETGTIWVTGSYNANPTYSNRIWVVRRGTPTPTGVAWEDVDPYSFDTTGLAKPDRITDGRPQAIAIRPVTVGLPEIFVGGRAANQRSGLLWVVRRSQDGGTTWTTVDQFSSQDMGAGLLDLAVSPTDGSIYAVGRIYETLSRKTGQYVGLVRRGVTTNTGGMAWTDVDRVIANPSSVSLNGVTVDGYGRVFVAGYDFNNGGWLVRASVDGFAPYVTTDFFAPGYPSAVVADPANHVLVAGRDGSGAIIRRLAAPQP